MDAGTLAALDNSNGPPINANCAPPAKASGNPVPVATPTTADDGKNFVATAAAVA